MMTIMMMVRSGHSQQQQGNCVGAKFFE